MSTRTHQRLAASVTTVALAASLAACGSEGSATPEATTPSSAESSTTSGSPSAPASDGAAAGATATSSAGTSEGTYTSTGTYQSPAGEESIDVSVTLSGGLISAVTVTPTATNPNSVKFQTAFASGISAEVVGKPLSEAKVTKVSGSSLTGAGFNAALEKIAAQAGA